MSNNLDLFCNILENRSIENQKSFEVLYSNGLWGNCFSILRQELDSLVRVLYLLDITDLNLRDNYVMQTLRGEKWSYINHNGKRVVVTDKDMVDLANSLMGWAQYVYKFGCSFIHLSNFHNYNVVNPFALLSQEEKNSIIYYMEHYHGAELNNNSEMKDFYPYLSKVMEKIAGNLNCYIQELKLNNEINIL